MKKRSPGRWPEKDPLPHRVVSFQINQQPRFFLVFQPFLLAVALSRLPAWVRLPGESSLGCYVSHNYATAHLKRYVLSYEAFESVAADSPLLHVLLLLGAAVFFQSTVGRAFHALLVAHVRAFFRALRALSCSRRSK